MPKVYDPTDIGSIFRYQYGIYASFGMSYDEFWNYDYKLVESFKVKHDQDIDRDVINNHELGAYIKVAVLESVANILKDPKKQSKPIEIYPKKPEFRSSYMRELAEREKRIQEGFQMYMREREIAKKEKPNA